MLQNIEAHGSPEVYRVPGLGELEQQALPGTGRYEKEVQVYSASVNAKLGRSDFASITGYNVSDLTGSVDYTRFRGAMALAQYGVGGAALINHFKTTKLTEELRLTTPFGERFEWLIGAFYNREDTDPRQQNAMAVNPATGAIAGALFYDTTPNLYEEYAAFTDLTVHFTDRFDVQIGGRQSHNEQSTFQVRTLTAGTGFSIPEVETSESAFTYLVTPRFKVSADLMVYARLASGYRPGGPNPNALALGLPPAFDADTTQNFEIGAKGSVLDRKLTFDASVYYIDWKDIQLQLVSPTGQGYFANASRAKSQGVELSIEARPVRGLTLSGWFAWNDAVLTEDLPAASTARAFDGDRLPVSSRVSGSLSLQQSFPLTGVMTGYVGGTLSYVGDRLGVFSPATAQRQEFPSYAKTDLSAGIKYDTWSFDLFVNNVADKRGVLSGGLGAIHPNAFTYIQPRTAGVSLSKTF
jgi:iron complex outermembrane recepter protein